MAIEDDISLLERNPTLSLLGHQALRILAIGAESQYVHTGNTLFEAGDQADGAFIVQDGAFRLSARADKPDEPELVIGPGTLVGEYSLLIETKRAVTATAIEPSTVIRISRNLFLKTLEGFPDAAGRLRKMVAARAEQMTADMQGVRKWLGEAPNYR